MSNIIQEKLIEEQPIPVSIEGTKNILFQMGNCICKIYSEDGKKGTGFFCKIPFINNFLPVLITNNHVLNEKDIDNNKTIELSINNEVKEIEIDDSRKKYTNSDKNIDITIIEIKPNKDGICNYLELDENDIYKNKKNIELEYKKKSIYILHYPKGKLNVSYGLIKDIKDNKKINHYCNTEEGSSGSPILSLETFKVIGIHYGSAKKNKYNYGTFIKYVIYLFNNKYRNKNEINIIYKTDKEGNENIFGDKFVENNKNNIELIINGNISNLIKEYTLKKGENNIKIIIKNKIVNLEYMFYNCKSLINIKELDHLDTKDINNFESIFCKCSSLSDIKGLENWNVSSGNNFSHMFYGCSSLSDIKSLEHWDVSNGNNFQSMFGGCSKLSNLKSIEHWNVSNGNNFQGMFGKCSSLSDIKSLKNWDVSNGNTFQGMFGKCSSLSDIKSLENWDVSNGNNFQAMFGGCSSLSELKALQKWNVSNGNNFYGMFGDCSSLSEIKGLENWNVSNGNNFSYMFCRCLKLSDIKSLENWNVSNGNNFSYMFYECSLLSDIKALQNWNLSDLDYKNII